MTSPTNEGIPTELLDLRGQSPPEQIQAAQGAVERASEGAITLVSELEVIPKFLLPAAAERGLRCRMEPPQAGEWRVTLRPPTGPADTPATEASDDSD